MGLLRQGVWPFSRETWRAGLGLLLASAGVALAGGCSQRRSGGPPTPAGTDDSRSSEFALRAGGPAAQAEANDARHTARRQAMVRAQMIRRGVRDTRVLAAMGRVPRHRFVPLDLQHRAYDDQPFPIGHGQTISQPYIVAFMTEALGLRGGEKVLEIGTGSGYQAAILAEVGARVFTIEIVEPLARQAAELLRALGHVDVAVRAGDGYQGWPEQAPFDAILLTAAPERIPAPLLEQLAPGGRLVAPVGGSFDQKLVRIGKRDGGLVHEELLPVRFVPMTGRARER